MTQKNKKKSMDKRDQFLMAMYRELMNDINRHIVVVWQSIATLIAAIAAFSLVKDGIVSLDIAVSIIVVVGFWLSLHVQDAGYWYNRNLAMIANIEKQFLKDDDTRNIHYYFGKHRPHKIIAHLKIQELLGFSIIVIALIAQFYTTLIPIINKEAPPYILAFLPLALLIAGLYLRDKKKKEYGRKYDEFVANSPGRKVRTKGIKYGEGHGFDKKK